ncbi:hypothetical protein TrRE_jg7946 [Triparma retinervis]|uniref:RCK N-terminal domain-containing protein n=1 Tax=Triparma retinervis TaxID=2557542 RepID=A0A9W7A4I8_9STRA|nr:hypothetical protein TrRE_jg7946 [Triparma retinervis]
MRSALDDLNTFMEGTKKDTMVILTATAAIPTLAKKLGASPVLGYLLAGTLIGPNCIGLISSVHNTEILAELGIVFFLFEMGIELSTDRLRSMKKDVFGLGGAQFGITSLTFALLFKRFTKLQNNAIVTLSGGLALSSSAFKSNLGTRFGKASFGVLLFQDLAVVPLLVAIPLLAGGASGMASALTSAVIKASMALSGIAFFGRWVLNPVFNGVASAKNREAFLGVTLLTVLSMSFLTEGLGLSNTLGAFLAGVLLSETKYRYQIEADVAPFRGVLLGLFFLTVGFEIDIILLLSKFKLIAGMVAGIVAVKAGIIMALACLFGLSPANGVQTGFLLSQGGEFAFVAFGLAKSLGILDQATTKVFLTSVALTMAATPIMATASERVAQRLEEQTGADHYLGEDQEAKEIKGSDDFVVVVGYGVVGKIVCDLLDMKFQRFIGIELDPKKAIQARNRGLPVFYGDSTRSETCQAFNVGAAKAVVITLADATATNRCVITLRREFPDIMIFARAVNEEHRRRLTNVLDVKAMVPILPEETELLTLPFGGEVLKAVGADEEEVKGILEGFRKGIMGRREVEDDAPGGAVGGGGAEDDSSKGIDIEVSDVVVLEKKKKAPQAAGGGGPHPGDGERKRKEDGEGEENAGQGGTQILGGGLKKDKAGVFSNAKQNEDL